MPSVYRCIWEKDTKVNFDSNRTAGDEGNMRTEKLFLCNAENGLIEVKNFELNIKDGYLVLN